MRINRERMKEEKKKADKKLMEQIKKDPKEYKASIDDVKSTKKILSEIPTTVDEELLYSVYEVASSCVYEAMAHGIKRKDLAFMEKFADKKLEEIKKNKKEGRKRNKEFEEFMKRIEKEKEELSKLFSD